MKRPNALGLAPNLEKEDALQALKLLFGWKEKNATQRLKEWFEKYLGTPHVYSFTSGRGALFAILKAAGVKKGDEVLLQAFTCVAVVDAIVASGATPVFVDCNSSYTISFKDLQKKISLKTKVVILQHTFGLPAISEELLAFLKKKKVYIIEDCAHMIGGEYKEKNLGTFGDGAIFSFGRDKAFSSVSGGVAVVFNTSIASSLNTFYRNQGLPSNLWIFQQLFHSISFYFLILPLYDFFSLGKLLLVAFQRLHLLTRPVGDEKNFLMYYQKLPDILSQLVLLQLERLSAFNTKRIAVAKRYQKLFSVLGKKTVSYTGPLLRYPIQVKDTQHMKTFFRQHDIYLGDWYSNIVDPKSVKLEKIGYCMGSCPVAEDIAIHCINLPTYPTLSDKQLQQLEKLLKIYGTNKTHY